MKRIIPYIIALCYIVVVLVAVSLLDILLSAIYPRFYTSWLFITTFAVGGIFAGCLGYMGGISYGKENSTATRWGLMALIAIAGILFYFLLSKWEGGEYGPAFKAYGITLALSMLLFVKEDKKK